MKLEWTRGTDRSGALLYANTPFCRYEVRPSGKTKFKALVHGVWIYGLLTECVGWTICEHDYDARVATLALANGYVKAEDYESLKSKLDEATDTLDQIETESVKFDAEEAEYLMAAVEKIKCDDCEGHCAISNNNRCLYHTLRTKLEALKEARDE